MEQTQVQNLMQRGRLALEDGDFLSADRFFESVLNVDVNMGEAHWGKLLAQYRCRTGQELAAAHLNQLNMVAPQMEAVQVTAAHDPKHYEVPGYLELPQIQAMLQSFDRRRMMVAPGRQLQLEQARAFWSTGPVGRMRELCGSQSASAKAEETVLSQLELWLSQAKEADGQTRQKAQADFAALEQRLEAMAADAREQRAKAYAWCKEVLAKEDAKSSQLKTAAKSLEALRGYEESEALAGQARERAAALDKKLRKRLILWGSVAVAVLVLALVTVYVIIPAVRYSNAETALEEGRYEAAIEGFEALEDYSDAADRVPEAKYKQAEAWLDQGEYDQAIEGFEALGDYEDAADRIPECKYEKATAYMAEGKFDWAKQLFENLGDYADAADRIPECDYGIALQKMDEGEYEEAYADFMALEDFEDSPEKAKECAILQADALKAEGKEDEAIEWYAIGGGQAQILKIYQTRADTCLAEGKLALAAINYYKAGDKAKSFALWDKVAKRKTVSAGEDATAAIKADGTVVGVGFVNAVAQRFADWRDIVDIQVGSYYVAGLTKDRTVVYASGTNPCAEWTDIVAISMTADHILGLRADGTVVAEGHSDHGQCEVEDWTDIVAIAAGLDYSVGLKADGTVVAVGYNKDGQTNVGSWTDIVDICVGGWHTLGLKADGTVVAVGDRDYGRCNVGAWKDVVAISAGNVHSAALTKDGTVLSVGYNNYKQCDLDGKTGFVAVDAGDYHTVALKKDGTLVAVGSDLRGKTKVSGLTGLLVP